MCGIWVYVEDTHSVTFLTPILLLVNFPVPLLPWVTPQDFAIRDHFFGFSKVRVWGRKKERAREGARELRRKDREEIYITEVSLLNTLQPPRSFCFSSDTFNSFPPQGLCTPCALCHLSLISYISSSGRPFPLLTQPVLHAPSAQFLFVPFCCCTLLPRILCYLKSYYLL